MFGYDDETRNGYLQGVNCGVKTCSFHGKNNSCRAQQITISNEQARNKSETLCSTYNHAPGL
jgi:hypothetical protein